MARPRILVVDDDELARTALRGVLEGAGYEVREAQDGRRGLRELYAAPADLVILDVAMPELDGWATLERIREVSDVPVLMLSVRETELERVRGLRGGADDYVAKPFGHQELTARVHALLRRSRAQADAEQQTYADALLEIDYTRRAVAYRGRELRLTPLEFKLLGAFVRHPNQVLSREQLLELVWGDTWVSPGQVKLYVGYLRRKLDPDAPSCTPIDTVRGFGYRYRRPA
jgi:DNA-binding response OmpR family regulator